MKIHTKKVSVEMEALKGFADLTGEVAKAIKESGCANGIATVFSVGSTAAVSTMEYEPGLIKDVPEALDRIAPAGADYEHHKTWGDDNGSSHVRSTVVGSSLVVPFSDRELVLGTWQQIVLMNLDTSGRRREAVIQVMGE